MIHGEVVYFKIVFDIFLYRPRTLYYVKSISPWESGQYQKKKKKKNVTPYFFKIFFLSFSFNFSFVFLESGI